MGLTLAGVMPRKKPPQTEFGVRLVALRQQRGLTQVQLAEASGLSQRVISYYETMPGYPAAVEAAFDADVDYAVLNKSYEGGLPAVEAKRR